LVVAFLALIIAGASIGYGALLSSEIQRNTDTFSSNLNSFSSKIDSLEASLKSEQTSTGSKLNEIVVEQGALKSLVEDRLGDISKELEATKAEAVKTQEELAKTKQELEVAQQELVMRKIIDEARNEGKMVLYTTQSGPRDTLIAEFEKIYPFIDVEFVRAGTSALEERIRSESVAGLQSFDVIETTDSMNQYMNEKGWLQPYISLEAKVFPEVAYDPEGYWYGVRFVILSLNYNTDFVTEDQVSEGWNAFTKPIFKDHISLAGADRSPIIGKAIMEGLERGIFSVEWVKSVFYDQNSAIYNC
jgi:translation initiation factor 1 (eIF-1/SUI1)